MTKPKDDSPEEQIAKAQTRCKSCGQLIVWGTTHPNGKRMPLDVPRVTMAQALDPLRPLANIAVVKVFTPHWATCPNAHEHRSRP